MSYSRTNLSLLSAPELADKTKSLAMQTRDEFNIQGDMRAVYDWRPKKEQGVNLSEKVMKNEVEKGN